MSRSPIDSAGGLRIAVNTTSTVAGGAITHLRHLLPALERELSDERLVVVGDETTLRAVEAPSSFETIVLPPTRWGFVGRLYRENFLLPRILQDWKPDVLFHPGNFAVFRCSLPQVILIHNLAPFIDEVIAGESALQRLRLRILALLTRSSLRRVARAIFISKWGRDLVLGNSSSSLRTFPIVPFGSEHLSGERSREDLDAWNLLPDQYTLTVSHVYRYKRLEKLINAYVALGDRVADWPLLIVGEPFDQEYTSRLREKAKRSVARIVFVGALGAKTIGSLMAYARAFVFTSEAENLPITLLEAMAAGAPVITNRHCSMPEVCGDAALYVDPATTEGYERALDQLLHDDGMRDLLKSRSLERAAKFSWSHAARMTLAELHGAAAESSL